MESVHPAYSVSFQIFETPLKHFQGHALQHMSWHFGSQPHRWCHPRLIHLKGRHTNGRRLIPRDITEIDVDPTERLANQPRHECKRDHCCGCTHQWSYLKSTVQSVERVGGPVTRNLQKQKRLWSDRLNDSSENSSKWRMTPGDGYSIWLYIQGEKFWLQIASI